MNILFERELEELKKSFLFLGTLVEESVQKAIRSLEEMDMDLANKVIDEDEKIDRKEIEIEEECLKILALHQPVAADLRFIVSVLKINNDLERIGDLATNVASRAHYLAKHPHIKIPKSIFKMASYVRAMLKESLDALVNQNADLAEQVIGSDIDVDTLHKGMYSIIYEQLSQDNCRTPEWLQVLAISRYLERMADHATNIAEDVIYLVNGEIVRHTNISD